MDNKQPKKITAKEKVTITKEDQIQYYNMKVYYGMVRAGQMFMQYLYQDLKATVNKELDRAKRRRMMKELQKGVISKEVIQTYAPHIEKLIEYVKQEERNRGFSKALTGWATENWKEDFKSKKDVPILPKLSSKETSKYNTQVIVSIQDVPKVVKEEPKEKVEENTKAK